MIFSPCKYRKGNPRVPSDVCEVCDNAKCRKDRAKIVRELRKIGKGIRKMEIRQAFIPPTT
jgi:hypothetical protein